MNGLRALLLVLIPSLFHGPAALLAQSPSVRGDANGDGKVSISDAFFMNAFMFVGSARPQCIESLDVDGNAQVDISDTVAVLVYLFLDGAPPCREDEASCELENTNPLDGGSVRILDASLAEDGKAVLTIGVTSEEEIGGLDLTISAGEAFANGQVVEVTTLQGTDFFTHARVRGKQLDVQYMTANMPATAQSIPAGEDVPVLELPVCLARGTPGGDVQLEITAAELIGWTDGSAIVPGRVGATLSISGDVGEDGCEHLDDPPPVEQEAPICQAGPDEPPPGPGDPPPPVETGEENDFVRGDANHDGFISISDALTLNHFIFLGDNALPCRDAGDVDDNGALEITDPIMLLSHAFLDGPAFPAPYLTEASDPTPKEGLSCLSYEVTPPMRTDDVVRFGDVEGNPGETVDIPVFVSNSLEVEAYQMILRFDPGVFTPAPKPIVTEGAFYDSRKFFFSVGRVVDGDKLLIGVYPSFIPRVIPLPPGDNQLVFKIRGTISDDAVPGTTMTLDSTVAEDGFGPLGLRNELTHMGQALFFGTRPQLVDGHLKIAPDITIFLRGDANDDSIVDQSDGIFLLHYIFLNGDTPPCPDAADANDSGGLEVSDPIVILQTIFRGTALIAAPYPEGGPDPTADELDPCVRSSEE